jgi:hypothetical protein
MPKVEGYQPTIAEQPLRTPYQRLDPGDGTLLLARGAENVADTMSKIGAQMQEEDDNAVIKERVAAYRTRSLETMEKYRGVMGRDAYDSREKVGKELEGYAKELGEGLTGRQAAGFNSAMSDYILRDKATISSHAFEQRTGWLNGQDEALVALAQEDYTAKPDPVYEKQIRSAAANLAARNGWAPEKQQLYADEKISEANVSIVNQYMDTSPAQAAAFYQANKDKILPSMRAPLEKQIVEEGRSVAEQAYVEALLVKYGDDEAAGLNDIRDNFSGPEEDRRVARWKARTGEIAEFKRVTKAEAGYNAVTTVWEKSIDDIPPDDVKYLKSMGMWDDVQQQHYEKVQGFQQTDKHDWLSENYFNLTLAEQARVDPVELRKHTTQGTFSALIKARDANRPPVVTETTNAYIKRILASDFKIDLGKQDKSDAENAVVDQFYKRYTADVQKFVDQKGYTPSEPELQAIVRGVAAESDLLVDRGYVWDSLETGPAFLVDTDENISALSEQLSIPAADLRAVMQYMTDKGIPLTKQNLITTYQAGSQ